MRSLDKKLFRDIWRMKGQAIAIMLVIASGVATFIMLISTMDSLHSTRESYYLEYRFAHVFAALKRAPENLRERIRRIPGVEQVETRVVADVKLEITGFNEPVSARLVSIPETTGPLLNRLYIKRGRLIDPLKDDEVLISDAFAEAHGFDPGESFSAIINGKKKELRIAGIALSPEFVLQLQPGGLSPDYKKYGIVWMGREALGNAYDMEGAFNNAVLTLSKGASEADVISRLDEILKRYGGLGAIGRKDQVSHRFLTEEFKQLQRSAEIFPTIFIAVAAFMLNVAISRTLSTQRDQMATLKAFGYSNSAIGIHYIKLVLLIVAFGAAGGVLLGARLGSGLSGIYMDFYRFPYLDYELRPFIIFLAALITAVAALAGTIYSVWRAASLPPAEAMRPEPPSHYRVTIADRLGLGRFLSQPGRMIFRNIERKPFKSALSITGIALSCAIMIGGTFAQDAVWYMIDVQFKLSRKEDIAVTFIEPTSWKALYELKGLAGVEHAEAYRSVPVKFRHEQKSYRTSILGIEPENSLYKLVDEDLDIIKLPPEGIILTDYLADMLGVEAGDDITVEVLESNRQTRQVPVAGIVKQYLGVMGFMDIAALNRLMREGGAISGAYLAVDNAYQDEIFANLVEMPRVAGANIRADEIRNFYETQAEVLLFFTFIASLLAGVIAFGVIYNSARIALSERGRELASLRVLGYTRAEIAFILLGEFAVLTIAAMPLGFIIGRGISAYIANAISSDLFRVPLVIEPSTYSLAATVVIISAVLSGIIVKHRLDRLDLVEVLKSRE